MEEQNRNYIVDFRTTHGDVEKVFNAMKEYQKMGIADRRSKIEFNGIRVPAGYLDDYEQFIGVYNGIIYGKTSMIIDSLPYDLSEIELQNIFMVCDDEMKKLNPYSETITYDYCMNRYEERQNFREAQKSKK